MTSHPEKARPPAVAAKAGRAGRKASTWNLGPMVVSARNVERHNAMNQISTDKHRESARKAAIQTYDRKMRERLERFQSLWWDGATCADMAKASGYTEKTVREYCERLGLTLARAEPRRIQKTEPDDLDRRMMSAKW